MKLVIVESPHKSETIGRYLGPEYKVVASKGHIRDLSTRGKGGLGIDVEHDFKPDFTVEPDKWGTVKELQKDAKEAEEVILATDPDREGEAISWHLAQVLHLDVQTTKRLQFHEITKPAILAALNDPKTIDMNLVESQLARRESDRIIGFKLSGLLQRYVGTKSAGRVQSATLKMIVDNDRERKAFKPEEYWTISIVLDIEGKKVEATLSKVDGKPAKIKTKEEAEAILARIPDALPVLSLNKQIKSIEPKFPFTTSTMQQEAYSVYHFSTSRTQAIAQRLYEGVEVGGEHVGLITYMRTDSARISPEFYHNHAEPYILERFGQEYLGALRQAKKTALTQDAHEAIRPTGAHRTPDAVKQYLEPDQAKLYRLIYCRAMASLMAPKRVENTSVIFGANGLEFSASGTRTIFPGYEAIYGEFEKNEAKVLPAISLGGTYAVSSKKDEQKFTQPPAAFNEAKVVKLMEEKGIGRPSTYASTIQTLQKSSYVSSKGGVLTPTEDGYRSIEVLSEYFPEIVSEKYTADMERDLDAIEKGEKNWLDEMEHFYRPFEEKYEGVAKTLKEQKPKAQETGELCPLCGHPLVVRKSKSGSEFIGCSNFPKCKYVKHEEEQPTGETCPECGHPLVYKKNRKGETFVGCSNYPSCHYVKREEEKPTGETCPECGHPLVYKKNRKGETFIACSNYPSCHYVKRDEKEGKSSASKRPANKKVYSEADYVKPCPECKTGHLVVKHGKRKDFLGCTNFPKCRHVEWLDEPKKKEGEEQK